MNRTLHRRIKHLEKLIGKESAQLTSQKVAILVYPPEGASSQVMEGFLADMNAEIQRGFFVIAVVSGDQHVALAKSHQVTFVHHEWEAEALALSRKLSKTRPGKTAIYDLLGSLSGNIIGPVPTPFCEIDEE